MSRINKIKIQMWCNGRFQTIGTIETCSTAVELMEHYWGNGFSASLVAAGEGYATIRLRDQINATI